MIIYNHRYRGPFEYDKFILNTLQLWNELVLLEKQLKNSSEDQLSALSGEFNKIFVSSVDEKSALNKLSLLADKYL